MYAVVIEQADRDPRVVVFANEDEAMNWRNAYEKATKGQWDSDPSWNHYPREPIATLSKEAAMYLLAVDLEADVKEFGENP
jgi:hypothetical protein